MIHELRLQEQFCQDKVDGNKPFEIRFNDRNFQKGDKVKYTAVDNSGIRIFRYPKLEKRTYEITCVIKGWGLKEGYVVFGEREIVYKDLNKDDTVLADNGGKGI